MADRLFIVTGAPGAGKSTTVAAFLALQTPYIAFDSDWLVHPASDLAGTSIIDNQTTWRPYRALWFEILHAIRRNGTVPVLFAAIDQGDVQELGRIAWCDGVEWLLLDCGDAIRRERLWRRRGWTEAMVDEALSDAAVLRAAISTTVDTGVHSPHHVAVHIAAWLDHRG